MNATLLIVRSRCENRQRLKRSFLSPFRPRNLGAASLAVFHPERVFYYPECSLTAATAKAARSLRMTAYALATKVLRAGENREVHRAVWLQNGNQCCLQHSENTVANRAVPIGNAPSRTESTVGGKPAYLKSVHQRTQAAIHASVMAMFSDWLRLNIRIVKNAYARPKETTIQCTVNP